MAWGPVLLAAVVGTASIDAGQDEVTPVATTVRSTTEHYEVRLQGTAEEAALFGKLLELAWPTYRDFFRAEPRLSGGKRLLVRIFASREACLDGAMDDHADMPPSQHPAWFSAKNGTVYLYRHTSDWFTRYLALYGACLQFHGHAKPKNRDLDTWYTHGIAESFAVHSFDGEKLELGTSPSVCWMDHPARAMAELGGKRLGLDPFDESRMENASVRWALTRFAIQGAKGRYRGRFDKLALGLSGSKVTGYDFLRSLGKEEQITEEFSVWLLSNQMPMTAVLPDWQSFPDGRIVAKPAQDGLALCVLKEGFTSIEATVEFDAAKATPGIILSLQDQWNYAVARIVPPLAFVDHVLDGKRRSLGSTPAEAKGGKLRFKVSGEGGVIELTIGDRTSPPIGLPSGRIGLACLEGEVTFRDLRWR